MGCQQTIPRPRGEALLLKEGAGRGRFPSTMKFGAIEILLLGLGTLVLTLIALWIREEILDWRHTRHHRNPERRARTRGRRWTD
jgi:hypothetical protein